LVVCLHLLEKFVTELFRALHAFRARSGNMEIHRLVALLAGGLLHKAGTSSFDLDFAARFLLNVFDVVSTSTDDLGSQVETTDRFKANGDLLFGPFAPTKLVAFEILRLAAAESPFIYQVRELLLHHIFNHGDSLL